MIKLIHVTAASISILGFGLRGILMIFDSPLLKRKLVRILPHVVDTILLVSAIILAVQLGASPVSNPWLAAKVVALVLYIALGMVALRGPSKPIRALAWLSALVVFGYIVAVAMTKSVTPGF